MDDNAKYNELKDKLKSVGCTFDMDKYNLKGFVFPDEYDHILCEYLGTFEKCRYKSRIVHCLAKPKKYKMIPVLLKEYDNNNVYETWTNQYRWYLSDALHRIGYNDNFFNEYMKIINNKQYGKAREPIVSLLGRSKRHEALEKLTELLHDWDHDVMCGIL